MKLGLIALASPFLVAMACAQPGGQAHPTQTEHSPIIHDSVSDVLQPTADYFLKGLPALEIWEVTNKDDFVKESTRGQVTEEQLYGQLEATLRRFHMPLTSPVQGTSYAFKDSVGGICMLIRTEGTLDDPNALVVVQLRVMERAILKRDPSLKGVFATLWEDEQMVDSPTVDSKNRFGEAVRELGERFALAYLAANKNR